MPEPELPHHDALRVGGVLLAAGESRRMGGPNKLELLLDGEPLVRRTARTLLAAGISPLVAVLGHAADRIEPLLRDLPVQFVLNDRYREGQQTSVQAGLRALTDALDAFVICLSDLPLMSPAHLRELIDAFAARGDALLVMPAFRGQRGNPIIFAGELRAPLLQTPDGPRGWIDSHPRSVRRLAVTHIGFTTDLDTLDDVASLGQVAGAPRVTLP